MKNLINNKEKKATNCAKVSQLTSLEISNQLWQEPIINTELFT